jgi:hypothetical protein
MSVRLILLVTAVGGGLITAGVFWMLGVNEKAADGGATRFAAALVHNDPGAAPKGSRAYVTGLRAYFGSVTDARVIGTHNEHAGDGSTARTFPVADVLVRSERGPAVIELAFDNGGIASEKVTGIQELGPEDLPELPAREREQLAAAYAARGGIPANELSFKQATAQTAQPVAPSPVEPSPPPRLRPNRSRKWREAQSQLRCVRRARGDVTKLRECARS